MKRSLSLIRDILIEIEHKERCRNIFELDLSGHYSDEQIRYHTWLCDDAGYITTSSDRPTGLTWRGHEVLGYIGDEQVWFEITSRIDRAGLESVSMEAILHIATMVTAQLASDAEADS